MYQSSWLPEGSFNGRTVIVTGGAGSFGRILCHALAAAGANVVVNDFGTAYSGEGSSEGPAKSLAKEICALGYRAVADTHSVLDAQKIVDTAVQAFGRVDVLINNAGVNKYGKFEDFSQADLRNVLETNALAPMFLCHAVWPLFLSQGYGRIVNVSSASVLGMAQFAPYITSKAGLVGLTKALSSEVGDSNIKVNAVAPCAASRMALAALNEPADIENFTKLWPPEGNVAIILALASEACEVNGEFFNTGAFRVNRVVFGMLPGLRDVKSAETILRNIGSLTTRKGQIIEQPSAQAAIDWVLSDASVA